MRSLGFLASVAVALGTLAGCGAAPEELVCGDGEILATVGDLRLDEPEQACVPEACGTASWPDADGTLIHLAQWGSGTGPGTESAPYGLLSAAIEAASPDGTVVVADGEYLENTIVGSEALDVTVVGRCTELVTFVPRDVDEPTIWIRGATLNFEDVTISGGRGLRAQRSDDGSRTAVVRLQNVDVEDTLNTGIEAQTSTELDLRDVTIRRNGPIEDGTSAAAILINTASRGDFRRVVMEDNIGSGIEALGAGTHIELEDVIVRDTVAIPPPPITEERFHPGYASGFGILTDGATMTATGVTLERNRGLGIYVAGPASPIILEDIVVREQRIAADVLSGWLYTGGHALMFTAGTTTVLTASATNVLVEDCDTIGIGVSGAGVEVDLEDITLRNLDPDPSTGWYGTGLIASVGATAYARNIWVENTHYLAIGAANNSFVSLEGADIIDTHPDRDSGSGIGLAAANDAGIVASDLRISNSFGAGAVAFTGAYMELTDFDIRGSGMADVVGLGSDLTLIDGSLSGAVPSPAFGGGVGLFAYEFRRPSRVVVEGVTFSDYPGSGIYLRGPGSFEIRDSTFENAGHVLGVPGGVFAAGGITAWEPGEDDAPGTGLLLENNHFDAMGLDAVLLDSSGGTLSGNTFGAVEGEPLYVQGCIGEHFGVDVEDQDGVDAACRDESRAIESLLLYSSYIGDALIE